MKIITDFRSRPPKPFKRGKIWHIRQTIAGKQVWRSLHTENRRDAEAIAYRLWFAQQSEIVKGSVLTPPKTPLSMAWESHVATERYRLLAESSKGKRKARWQAFVSWAEAKNIRYVEDIESHHATAYLESMECKGKTWNNVRGDLLPMLPIFAEVELRSTTRGEDASDVIRPLSDDEITRILDYFANGSKLPHRHEWRAAVLIALGTGLRYSCVAKLRWDEITDGVLDHVPRKTARLGKSVLIRLPPMLISMLSNLPHDSEYILPKLASDAAKKSTEEFNQALDRLKIASNDVGLAGFHSLRVTFATKARAAGIDADLLGGILGHGDKRMTEHYNRASASVDLSAIEWSEKK